MKFPDAIPATFSEWATFIPGRTPEFKTHTNQGLANNAIGQRSPWEECAKYHLVDDEWVKVFERRMPEYCENEFCREKFASRRSMNRSHAKPSWSAKIICNTCHRKEIYR